MNMFCFQCEQTAKGTGCTSFGVCGKDPETAALQDLLIEVAKGAALVRVTAEKVGVVDSDVDSFIIEALFTTVTNVNFDPARLAVMIRDGAELRDRLWRKVETTANGNTPTHPGGPAALQPADDMNELIRQGEAVGLDPRIERRGDVLAGLEELVTYGLKGMASYADHARILGIQDDAVDAFFAQCLAFLTADHDLGALLAMALKVGEVNFKVMEMLDSAHTGTYGHPKPTQVNLGAKKGKAILISGHDMKDLEELLKQTEGTGINVYTHGEMLPAHGYPGLKKYPHLVGNYGGAWQDQRKEFDAFPGAILMTTNCIQKPKDSYFGRIFTCGLVAWPGVQHIADRNFAPVIQAALDADGFAADEPEKTILVGFGHNAVLGVAPQVIDAVKKGAIRHFYLVGGCDGAKTGRDYYTKFAEQAPKDTIIMTLACGKYRFNKLEFGDIGGIPRLLDVGQCNDAYSAIKIATALADAFDTDVNSLPLSLILSWYEQKAVCILLTLLHLGIKNIRLGPTLPAFLAPPVIQTLVDNFGLMPITTAEDDLAATLGQ